MKSGDLVPGLQTPRRPPAGPGRLRRRLAPPGDPGPDASGRWKSARKKGRRAGVPRPTTRRV